MQDESAALSAAQRHSAAGLAAAACLGRAGGGHGGGGGGGGGTRASQRRGSVEIMRLKMAEIGMGQSAPPSPRRSLEGGGAVLGAGVFDASSASLGCLSAAVPANESAVLSAHSRGASLEEGEGGGGRAKPRPRQASVPSDEPLWYPPSSHDLPNFLNPSPHPPRQSVTVGMGSASMYTAAMRWKAVRREEDGRGALSGAVAEADEEGEEEEGADEEEPSTPAPGTAHATGEHGGLLVPMARLLELSTHGGRGYAGLLEEGLNVDLESLVCAITSALWQGVSSMMAIENFDAADHEAGWAPPECVEQR